MFHHVREGKREDTREGKVGYEVDVRRIEEYVFLFVKYDDGSLVVLFFEPDE